MKNILFLFLILFISCKNETKKTEKEKPLATLTITSNDSINIKLSKIHNIGTLNIEDEKSIVTKDKSYKTSEEINKLEFYLLLANNSKSLFYIGPDMKRNIKVIKDEKDELTFVFDEKDYVNNFTNTFHKKLKPLFASKANEKEILELINIAETEYLHDLSLLKSKIDSVSYYTLSAMVTGKMSHLKFIHSNRFENLTAQSSYYDFTNNFDFNNDNYLVYSDNLNTVLGVIRIQYERKYKTPFDEAPNKIKFINEIITNNEIKSAIISFVLSREIPEKTELEKIEILTELKELKVGDYYYNYISAIEAGNALGRKVGSEAKYFESLTSLSQDFSIESLKGKTIYVDNWATWCSPCVKSMKKFLEKHKTLQEIDNVVYVFVSYDRNETIWKNYIKKMNFPQKNIIHLFNGSNMKSAYAKYYNISGLPSYFVVNEKGIISDINPINPSDNDFEDFIKKTAGL